MIRLAAEYLCAEPRIAPTGIPLSSTAAPCLGYRRMLPPAQQTTRTGLPIASVSKPCILPCTMVGTPKSVTNPYFVTSLQRPHLSTAGGALGQRAAAPAPMLRRPVLAPTRHRTMAVPNARDPGSRPAAFLPVQSSTEAGPSFHRARSHVASAPRRDRAPTPRLHMAGRRALARHLKIAPHCVPQVRTCDVLICP
jgi:hypothetical protein